MQKSSLAVSDRLSDEKGRKRREKGAGEACAKGELRSDWFELSGWLGDFFFFS